MTDTSKVIVVIIIVILVALGAWWFFTQTNQSQVNNQQDTQLNDSENPEAQTNNDNPLVDVEVDINPPAATHEITYTNSGYSPANLTIKKGDTVRFKNSSTKEMWPASAMHPTHAVYSGTSLQQHCPDNENDDFDACKGITAGQSWEFTFKKTGAWNYHDHISSGFFGKITVE
jgi:plastocyanin